MDQGERALKLRGAVEKATRGVVKKLRYKELSSCFPKMTEKPEDADRLRAMSTETAAFMHDGILDGFQQIVERNKMVGKMNEMDVMVKEAKQSKHKPLPYPLVPERLVGATVVTSRKALQGKLLLELAALQMENRALMGEIKELNRSRSMVQQRVVATVQEAEKLVEVLQPVAGIHNQVSELVD
jgi:hypothetical protein